MKLRPGLVAVVSRALALCGLLAMNVALPAEAEADSNCWQCVTFPGWPPGCLGGQDNGKIYCESTGSGCISGGVCGS